jgi:hypothetical protein
MRIQFRSTVSVCRSTLLAAALYWTPRLHGIRNDSHDGPASSRRSSPRRSAREPSRRACNSSNLLLPRRRSVGTLRSSPERREASRSRSTRESASRSMSNAHLLGRVIIPLFPKIIRGPPPTRAIGHPSTSNWTSIKVQDTHRFPEHPYRNWTSIKVWYTHQR